MRILHVIHSLTRGGLENGVVNLVNRLPGPDFEQAICCLYKSGEMEDRINRNIDIFELYRKSNDLELPRKLAKIIKSWQPDIIHSRNWNSWLDTVIANKISGNEAILLWSFHGFADGNQMPLRRRIISKLLSYFTDEMFAVCKDSAMRYAKNSWIPNNRFAVLYNGVDCQKYSVAGENKRGFKKNLDIEENMVVILTVASLTPVKNHKLLINAAKRLSEHTKKVLFIFIGDGGLRKVLSQQIKDLNLQGRVLLAGARDNVSEYLAAADIFVLPSSLEGMSNAILEAMASGLPIVANKVGGNTELVVHEETGFLCELDNEKQMVTALKELIEDESKRLNMGIAARKRTEELFSIESMVAAYGDYYSKIYRKHIDSV